MEPKIKNSTTKNAIIKILTGGWAIFTVWSSIIPAINLKADPFYLVIGSIASIGAIITAVKVCKENN